MCRSDWTWLPVVTAVLLMVSASNQTSRFPSEWQTETSSFSHKKWCWSSCIPKRLAFFFQPLFLYFQLPLCLLWGETQSTWYRSVFEMCKCTLWKAHLAQWNNRRVCCQKKKKFSARKQARHIMSTVSDGNVTVVLNTVQMTFTHHWTRLEDYFTSPKAKLC